MKSKNFLAVCFLLAPFLFPSIAEANPLTDGFGRVLGWVTGTLAGQLAGLGFAFWGIMCILGKANWTWFGTACVGTFILFGIGDWLSTLNGG